ncbi:hypothetical protein ACFPM0_35775 [Pseudonocardia sulfidoxydans]|uniref:hypothetical protein n=1 Tax=Pseudonocardia sulfidoxydans TaxID=54011 RepID=UPI003618D148
MRGAWASRSACRSLFQRSRRPSLDARPPPAARNLTAVASASTTVRLRPDSSSHHHRHHHTQPLGPGDANARLARRDGHPAGQGCC